MKTRYWFAKTATFLVVFVALFGFSRVSFADPVDVSFATSVATNNYALDFSVMNHSDGTNSGSLFGAALPATDIAGSAGGWGYAAYDNPSNNANAGGSGGAYNNTAYGVARISVDRFAFANNGIYNGSGRFSNPYNASFEGVSGTGSGVMPAPATLMLLGTGLVGLAGTIRSRVRF